MCFLCSCLPLKNSPQPSRHLDGFEKHSDLCLPVSLYLISSAQPGVGQIKIAFSSIFFKVVLTNAGLNSLPQSGIGQSALVY